MSSKPQGSSNTGLTRRRVLQRLGLASVVGSVGCQDECARDLAKDPVARLIVIGFTGTLGSLIFWKFDLEDEFGRGPVPDAVIPDFQSDGIAAGSAGGPPPGSSSGGLSPGATLSSSVMPPQAQQGSFHRAIYLLERQGDADVDGRVYAVDVNETEATLRGQVGLRLTDRDAPFLDLRHIALSPDGNTIIVSQQGAPSQWIFIDAASLTIAQRVMAPPDQFARRALFSPDGKLAFLVAGTTANTASPSLLHIADTATRAIIGAVDLPVGTVFADLAVTLDGLLLYGAAAGFLHVIDLRTATYGGRILVARPANDPLGPMAGRFQRILMDPSGAHFYAGPIEFFSDNRFAVGVFDVRTVDMIAEMTVRESPSQGNTLMALSPSGQTLLYGVQLGTVIQIFDTSTATEVETIPVEPSFRLTTLTVA